MIVFKSLLSPSFTVSVLEWANGLELAGILPDLLRIRLRLFLSRISWPAFGAAVTMVPGVIAGGGSGLSVRNKGWM